MTSTQILERARETIVKDGQTAKHTPRDAKGLRCVGGHLLEAAGLGVQDWSELGVENTPVNKAALRVGGRTRPVPYAAYSVCDLNNADPGIHNIVAAFDRALEEVG